jgi:hypothetical protein
MLLYNAQEPTDFESYQERGDIGFTDVAGAQIDTFMYEDLSNSRERNLDSELLKEVYKVSGLAPEIFGPKSVPQTNPNAPKILQDAWNETAQGQDALRLSDWEGMVEPNLEALKERFPDANIRNRDEIDTDIASQAKAYRDEFEEVYSYADPYAGFFGTLGGAAVASMADPINMMTLPLGSGKVAGASFIKGLGIVVARNFGIGLATEAALQPFVYDYKKEIESPYDLQDALFNMAAAGVGNGLLNGLGHTIGKGFDKIVSKQELPDTHETRKLRKDIQALLELQAFADETGAKTVGELEVHLKALNTAMADIEAGRQVDYDSLGKTIEDEYLELFNVDVNGARATMDYIVQKRYELEESFDPGLLAKQEQLQKSADQKLTKWELKQAQTKADIEATGELNQETDLGKVREIQKADFDRSVGEDTVRQNEEANIANNDLRASRRDEGDMIALKEQIDSLDKQYSEQVDYHSAAKKARDQYVADKAEETNQAIAVAPTDTPRMMAVKTAVNRIAASMGANDIKVRVYEGNPELDGDMRFSMDDGEGSAAWKAAEAKGLDMSYKARMTRAKDMGFDTSTTYFHGSQDGRFQEFKKSGHGELGKGVYLSKEYKIADDYSRPQYGAYRPEHGDVKSLFVKGDMAEIDRQEYLDLRSKYMDQLRADNGGEWKGEFYNKAVDMVEDYYKQQGYVGLNLKNPTLEQSHMYDQSVVFNPKSLRSVNAAFDPDFIDSPNLRYSLSKEEVAAMRALATKQRHGDDVDTDYRMTHTSPIREGANSIDDLSDIYPNDVYDESLAVRYYGTGDKAMDAESARIIASLQDNPDAYVTIYRSVPEGVDDINAGDWVSINREYVENHGEAWVDNGKYTILEEEVRARDIVTNGDSIHEWGYDPDGRLGERFSKQGDTIEAAINPETGELHINASAFRDEAHLMEVMREEIIGHYGLRKSLGGDFQGVIDDIKSTALTNPELRQMWVDLSGIDPQTRQIINPNAPYKGMADDVIADEIISKMAREEVSDTTFMTLKNIIIKALRKIGLVKDDITISEMRALVVKSEQALKKNVVKQPRITGLKPQLKQIDEALNNEAIDTEAARIVVDETNDQVIFDQNGNTINLRDALMEDDNDIAAIESVKVCML